MPKKKPKKIKRAAPAKQVTVRSRAYGEHTRSARGSIKPAVLNNAMIEKGKQLRVINSFASTIHTLLKQHAGFFKETMLWQKMLGRMHTATDAIYTALLDSLNGLELNSRYPLRRFGMPPFVSVTTEKRKLIVQLNNIHVLRFNNKVTAYRYDIMILFFTANGKLETDIVFNSYWFAVNTAAGTIVFDTVVSKNSKLFLVCLRLHGGKDDEPVDELSTQGMVVVKVGSC